MNTQSNLSSGTAPPLPWEPPVGLLHSMAIRHDHALAVPGFYDHPIYRLSGNNATHEDRYNHAIRTMLQLYEEVSGHGFFSWPNDQVPPPAEATDGRLPTRACSADFLHGGVWCCTEKSQCQWQGFALHQGLAWGTTNGPTTEWKDRHNASCRGRLIQLIPPNVIGEARADNAAPPHDQTL
jgi:hypothetical protein